MTDTDMPESLKDALDSYHPSNFLGYDFWLSLGGTAGGIALAIASPGTLSRVIPVAAAVVGVVIGAVVAGVAVLAAFLDQAFLTKLKQINRQPIRYMRPFLFTASLGVVALILLLVLISLPASTPTWLVAVLGGLAGTATIWTLTSVLPCLDMLVQFVGLRFIAADAPGQEEPTK